MTTFTFYPTDGGEYDGSSGSALENHTGGGTNFIQGTGDNDCTVITFDSNAIRTALAGYNITGCHITFYVDSISGSTPIYTYFGTHNYTAVPSSWTNSRVKLQRVRYSAYGAGKVTGLDLGTTIGAEFRDGVSTGLMLGPVPSGVSATDNTIFIRPQDTATTNKLVLTIDAVLANTAPNAPTLNSPAAGAVVDASQGLGFNWTHSDPQGDAMAGWYFRRNKGGGVYDYWNGTAFVATETKLTTATVPLTNGIMSIPGGAWANGQAYSWSVATQDPSGLKGPYAADRTLYTSVPPTAVVTAPTDGSTLTTSRPTISWTFSDTDSPPQYGWSAQIVPASVYSDPGFNPDNYLGAAWSSSGTGTTASVAINKDLVNHTTYRAYVKLSSSPNPSGGLQWSGWSYTTFSVVIPPYSPQILSPQNGSIADLGSTGFSLTWQNTYFSNVGSQTAFAIRRLATGTGAATGYHWWNGATWGTVETFLAGTQTQYAFRAAEVANGFNYTFSVAIRDDYNQVSPYSTGNTVTAATVGQVTVVAPQGVTVTSRPVVTWTMFQAENDPQQTYQVKVIDASLVGDLGTFNPASVTAVWDTGEVTDAFTRNVSLGVDLVNNTSYYVFVRVKTGGLYSSWSYQPFNIFLVPPGTPAVTTVVHNDMGTIDVVVQGRDSMLTDAASRNADGWMEMTQLQSGNAVVTNGIFYGSAQSHLVTEASSRGPGNMMVHSMDDYPVQEGFTYTGAVTLIAPVGVAPVAGYAVIHWISGTGDIITSSYGQSFADQSAVRSTVSAVAPPGAMAARLGVQWQNIAAAGARHRFFDPVLRPGQGGEWSPGGLLQNTTVSVTEVLSGRALRFGAGVPVPTETQQVIVTDEEAPIGQPVQYEVTTRAVYANATLSSVLGQSAVTSWTSGFLWISDPTRVGSGRVFNPQKFDKVTKPVRQGLFRPLGRPDAIIVGGVRALREGTFTIVTYTRIDREDFDDLVANSEVLLLRMPPDQGEDVGDAIYFKPMSDAPEVRPLDNRTVHRTIQMSWIEQYRPLTFLDYSGSTDVGPAPSPMNM